MIRNSLVCINTKQISNSIYDHSALKSKKTHIKIYTLLLTEKDKFLTFSNVVEMSCAWCISKNIEENGRKSEKEVVIKKDCIISSTCLRQIFK